VGLVGSAILMAPGLALAQAAPSSGTQLEEVVVTARRQEERLQTTPVAVTAVSGAAMERAQIKDVSDVQRAAPNLSISTGTPAATGFAFISLRGQANLNGTTASDSSVGIYLDGVYVARPAGALFDLVDMQQVEVLRGPQGTLFGRNTVGGALNLITNKPTGDFGGSIQATYGNFDDKEVTGVVNLPLVGDQLAVRLVYQHKERDGYTHNLVDNSRLNDVGRDNYLRAQVRVAPAGQVWDLNLSADWNESRDAGQLNSLSGWNPLVFGPGGAFGFANLGPALNSALQSNTGFYNGYAQSFSQDDLHYAQHSALKNYGASATLNADLGKVNFKSITGWRKLDTEGGNDLDGTPIDILHAFSRFQSTGWSQEFQLSGHEGAFSWIGGLYYFQETGREVADAKAFGFLGVPYSKNDGDVKSTSKGAYLQGYYDITERLRASAGIRYTWDSRSVDLHNLAFLDPTGAAPSICGVASVVPPPGCSQPESAKFDYPAYTASLDYKLTDDIFVYAKTSGAKMSGGFNLRLGSIPAFAPEGVKDVEGGIKADWFDHRLRTNIAVFHSWQSNVQRGIGAVVDGRATAFVRNAGDAHVSGVEFEGLAAPWKGMEINTTVGYLDGAYKKGAFNDLQVISGIPGCAGGQPIGTYSCTVDRSGEPLPQTPRWTYSIGASQTVPLDFGKLVLHADYSFFDSVHYNALNTPAAAQPAAVQAAYATQNALDRAAGYGLLNGKITLVLDKPGLELSVWGRNLTDKKYITRTFADLYTSLGVAVQYDGAPRTYGVTLKYKFGS
jgi:iron complex outermembrane receptor protein